MGSAGLVVVGAQWGDEGKGKIVHWLASRAHTVVRYQGGNNAGHTVVFGGKKYALHSVPSGILVPNCQALIGNGVVLNLGSLREEVRGLERSGIRVRGRLRVSSLCHLVLPHHMHLDALREEGGAGVGSTKRGIGPCYEDKAARLGIRVCDFLDRSLFEELLEKVLREREGELTRAVPLKTARAEALEGYEGLRAFLKPLAADVSLLVSDALDAGRRVMFEGAQGVMLDVDHGTYPFVTSSSPIAGGACVGVGVGPTRIRGVLGVSKAYTTRVGLGPFPTELEGTVARYLREAGGEYGTTTGRPRRIGWLDLVQLRQALRAGGIDRLALTKLDTLAGVHPLRVCVAYKVRGRKTTEFPCARRDAFEAVPVYEDFPGFSGGFEKARSFAALPKGARDYVLEIERRLGVPIPIVSIGRDREQTLLRGPFRWPS
ncbi:MAG: adenylosuccinate synthase [Elusimicrobiota bacterium]|jgi:adenylosuccinate synthase